MNVRSGRTKTRTQTSSAARKDPKFTTQLCRLLLVLFLFGTIASAICLHIYMNQQIAETGRKIKDIKQEITVINIELSNLKVQYEQSCSPEYIRRQMARFNLKLEDPEPGQVYRMAVFSREQARKQALLLERRQKYAASRSHR
ncbi:MAG: hypothetical protein E7044_01815 [Lentisphaerae bacterium]|nr:hypothetical protein [Lentisphaerota bacterium]